MECRKDAGSTVNPSAIGLPDQAFLSEVRIFYHLTPKMQSILYEAKKFKNQHHYQYCQAKNSVVYLGKDATARPIQIKGMDDLQRLADKYDQSCIVGNRMAQCSTDYYNRTILQSYLTLMSILFEPITVSSITAQRTNCQQKSILKNVVVFMIWICFV